MNRITNVDDIELLERYDQEDDIYYVTVKTGEPSFVVEHDDKLLIETGFFTGMPTGFRILNFSKHRGADGFKQIFKAICKKAGLRKIETFKAREQKIEQFLDKVMA